MSDLMIGLPHPPPERVLAVGAHPDDIDVCAAGTLALWRGQGVAVTYCVITDGDAGGFDPSTPREEIPGIRRREQREAAAEAGVEDVVFLGYRDGDVSATQELRRDLSRVIRRVRPQIVISHSPDRVWEARVNFNHPDHFASAEATLFAVYPDSRNRFAHPELIEEGLEPYAVDAVWVIEPERPNRIVDIAGTFEIKIAALSRHASQFPRGVDVLRPHLEAEASRLAHLGTGSGVMLAEGFRVAITSE